MLDTNVNKRAKGSVSIGCTLFDAWCAMFATGQRDVTLSMVNSAVNSDCVPYVAALIVQHRELHGDEQ